MPKFPKRPEDRVYKTPTSLDKLLGLLDPNQGSAVKQVLMQSALDQNPTGSGVNAFNTLRNINNKNRSVNGWDVITGALELAKMPAGPLGDVGVNVIQEGSDAMADFEGDRKPFKTGQVPTSDNTKITNMKRKKYEGGTGAEGVGGGGGQDYSSLVSGGTQLLGQVFNLMKTLGDRGTYTSQPVVTQRQTAAYNPYSKDFGNTNLPQFAMGGMAGGGVPIEVEDDEVLETPGGAVAKVNGNTHAEGGEDMSVPHGTKIFSDRIKIGDKTMAERKANRVKIEARIQRLVSKNPTDQLLKNSLKRTMEVNAMEEAQDMEIQMLIGKATQGSRQKFGDGGVAGEDDLYPKIGKWNYPEEVTNKILKGNWALNNLYGGVDLSDYKFDWKPSYETTSTPTTENISGKSTGGSKIGIDWNKINQMLTTPNVNLNPQTDLMTDTNNGTMKGIDLGTDSGTEPTQQVPIFNWGFNDNYQNVASSNPKDNGSMSASGFTLGDGIGMAGNLFGAFAPLMNTMANRRGDKPNINAFKNFGKDALDANEDAQGYIRGQRENAEEDLKTSRNASKLSNRDGARGINTIRALDLATDLGYNKGTNQIYKTFAEEMMAILGQKSQLENIQDAQVMGGEQRRDMADRADRDAFYSNRGADFSNLGTNVQSLGKNLNTNKGNQDMINLMAQLSKYGLGYTRDKKGNITLQKIEE